MKWMGHVAHMEDMKKAHKNLPEYPKGKGHLEKLAYIGN
jgi:hypothetical protein